jgi:hypothetical protein
VAAAGHVASAQVVCERPGPWLSPARSVMARTMSRPHRLLSLPGCVAGPGSVTSIRAHRGAVRTVTVNVPWSLAADHRTALLASSQAALKNAVFGVALPQVRRALLTAVTARPGV